MQFPARSMRGAVARVWRRGVALALGLAIAACSTAEPGPVAPIALRIVNRGSEPIHCMVNFGHWVTQDLGVIESSDSKTLQFHRQPSDGALYVPRADGQRLMMIENIFCSAPDDSAASRGQVPLLPIQTGRSHRYASVCRSGTPVRCEAPEEGG
ncbi:MAG TPA: hypothetical protein VHA10_15155 [Hypericibacter adhaerens]|jgi:hypothetical protein|uniref:Lipoprotein n=1 Tax=Hypericibacter adhaerens TaxID=2602016 RepID=A0A5J6N5R2_9PROT|nr:hypothetical protein [Hypericibacter adhaerens]QEX23920.1 hypothetical protein FRZ61_38590 [Hypericibacter adhaerens]HWA44552.1 hypothetical protein [Hypericibacter adhaerens]